MSCNCKIKRKDCCQNRKTPQADWDKCLNPTIKTDKLCKPNVILQKDNVNAPNSSNFSRFRRWAHLNNMSGLPSKWRSANIANFQDLAFGNIQLYFWIGNEVNFYKQSVNDQIFDASNWYPNEKATSPAYKTAFNEEFILKPYKASNTNNIFKVYIPYCPSGVDCSYNGQKVLIKNNWNIFKLKIKFGSGLPAETNVSQYNIYSNPLENNYLFHNEKIKYDRDSFTIIGQPTFANSLGTALIRFGNYAGAFALPIEIIADNRGYFQPQQVNLPRYIDASQVSINYEEKLQTGFLDNCSLHSTLSTTPIWTIPNDNSGHSIVFGCYDTSFNNNSKIINSYKYIVDIDPNQYNISLTFSNQRNTLIFSDTDINSNKLSLYITNTSQIFTYMKDNSIPLIDLSFNIKTQNIETKILQQNPIFNGTLRFNSAYYLNWQPQLQLMISKELLILPHDPEHQCDYYLTRLCSSTFPMKPLQWRTTRNRMITFKLQNYKYPKFDYNNPCCHDDNSLCSKINYNIIIGDIHKEVPLPDLSCVSQNYSYGFCSDTSYINSYVYVPDVPYGHSTFPTDKIKFFLGYGSNYSYYNGNVHDLKYLTNTPDAYSDYSNNIIEFNYDISNSSIQDLSNNADFYTILKETSDFPPAQPSYPDGNKGMIIYESQYTISDFHYRKPSHWDPSGYFSSTNTQEDTGLNIDLSSNNGTVINCDISRNINKLKIINDASNTFNISDNVIINVCDLDLSGGTLILEGSGSMNLVGPFKIPTTIHLSMFVQGKSNDASNAISYPSCSNEYITTNASDQALQNINFNLFEPVDISYANLITDISAGVPFTIPATIIRGTYPINLTGKIIETDISSIQITKSYTDTNLFLDPKIILKSNMDLFFPNGILDNLHLDLTFNNLESTDNTHHFSQDISMTIYLNKPPDILDIYYATSSYSDKYPVLLLNDDHKEILDTAKTLPKTKPNSDPTKLLESAATRKQVGKSGSVHSTAKYTHIGTGQEIYTINIKKHHLLNPGPGLCIYDLSSNTSNFDNTNKNYCCIHKPLEGNNGSTIIVDISSDGLSDLSNCKLSISRINLADNTYNIFWRPYENNDTDTDSSCNRFKLTYCSSGSDEPLSGCLDSSCSDASFIIQYTSEGVEQVAVSRENYTFYPMNIVDYGNSNDISFCDSSASIPHIPFTRDKFYFNIQNGDIYFPTNIWPNSKRPIRFAFQVMNYATQILKDSDVATPYTTIVILRPM